MDHAVGVREVERGGQWAHDAHRVLQREAQPKRQEIAQAPARQVLHREPGDALVLAVLVGVGDSRVGEPLGGEHLVLELGDRARGDPWVKAFLAQDLQRDGALGLRVGRLVHGRERARADHLGDLVLSQLPQAVHRLGARHSPSIFIACTRLVRMRSNELASAAISSLPLTANPGASSVPRLTWSATWESFLTGWITM